MKTIIVDFSNYDAMCGFGEIARNYAPRLATQAAALSDMHFIFILPEKHRGEFGNHLDYITCEHFKKEVPTYLDHCDLWHITDQQTGYVARGGHAIRLLTVHDLNYLYEKHGIHLWKHKILKQRHIRRADVLTVISKYVQTDVMNNIRGISQLPTVIYNGINDIEKNQQQRPAFIDRDDEKFFFTIGQVRRKKNFHVLVPMMKYLPEYKLYICGDHHWDYYDDIVRLIAPEDRQRIMLPGKISEAEKCWLYAHAQAFLFPSTLEGFGIPVLEAMRFGTKVFSSRYSCLPEICAGHASYWDNYEAEAMAQVVRQGLENWHRDGEAAKEACRYSQSFNYDRYTQEYLTLYRKLLGLLPLT
ncbi:MAG: glycosyltransferase family 4 protein [Prevotella sp.]|nr:glycosyltransferase family 4 protein [Prevotella sp.]